MTKFLCYGNGTLSTEKHSCSEKYYSVINLLINLIPSDINFHILIVFVSYCLDMEKKKHETKEDKKKKIKNNPIKRAKK